MANELKHGSVGTELTQAEWEGVGAHVFNSQATGDIVYASTSAQLSRLAKGTDTHVLILSSGIPAWSASTGITAVGTIATGVWQGTDVGVAYGGTGVSTLTDGGILLGSGASAITAMAVLTDGQMIVGDGTTDPVAESGATLRTSVGVGTGDSPQFSKFSIGGALDNQERLRIHPNTAPSTGSGTIFPVLQTTGGSVTVTGQSGAVYNHRFGSSTLTAGSSTTVPTYATVYIPSAATAGSNTTITANYALFVDAGVSRFDGDLHLANDTWVRGNDTAGTAIRMIGMSSGNDVYVGAIDAITGSGSIFFNVDGATVAAFNDDGNLDLVNNDLTNVGNSGSDWTAGSIIVQAAGFSGLTPQSFSTTAATAAYLNLDRSNHASINTHTAVDNDDVLGYVSFRGSDSDSFETGAGIKGVATETWSGSARGSELVFSTTDNTTTVLDPRMTIDHNGNVGVGADVASSSNIFNIQKTDTAAARGLVVQNALTLPSGGGNGEQIRASGTIATPAESTVYTTISTVRIHEPVITLGSGSSLTNSAALYIPGAATEASNDYALFVDAGLSRFDGGIDMAGSDLLNIGAAGSDWDTTSLRNAGDYFGANGKGMVIGNSAKITAGNPGYAEFQEHGTVNADASMILGRWSGNDDPARFAFVKSRGGIGTITTVADNDRIGEIEWYAANDAGTPGWTLVAGITVRVDDTNFTAIGGEMEFSTSTVAGSNTGRMLIKNDGMIELNPAGGAIDHGFIFDGNAVDYHIGLDDTADDLVIGIGTALGTTRAMVIDSIGHIGYNGGGTAANAINLFTNRVETIAAGYSEVAIMYISTGSAITLATGTTTLMASMIMHPPNIVEAGGAGVLNTATLYIGSAASEGSTANHSLWVNSGTSRFGGGAIIGDSASLNNLIDDASGGSGSTTLYVGNASITVSSDERLKTDIRPTAIDALSLVDAFKVVDFGWDDPTDTVEYNKNYRGRYTGMIAQDTVKIAPWIINDQGGGRDCNQCMSGGECDDHGMWQVEYQHLVPTLVKAIQELNEKIQELEHGNR